MQKNLGQHFLTNQSIASTIVETLTLKTDDTVVEIGPGTGVLTKLLLKQARRVIAIEKDEQLVKQLGTTFENALTEGSLEIIHDDIRNFDPSTYNLSPGNYKIIGNIPYYITGRILRIVLSAQPQPSHVVFMVQKEVAERIVARGGKESVLSISVKAYGTPRYVKTVKRGSFNPPPRVDSAILAIENISREFFADTDEDTFFALVKKGFSHKRKQLQNNLALSEEVFHACNIQPKTRAEDLTPEHWRCVCTERKNLH